MKINRTGDKWNLISSAKHIITYNSWDALKLLNTRSGRRSLTVVKMQCAMQVVFIRKRILEK